MKRILIGLTVLAAGLVLPLSAGATRSMPVTLNFSLGFTSATEATGTWTADTSLPGLAGKSGTATEKVKITGKGKVVHGRKLVVSEGGSFVILFNGKTKEGGSVVDGRFVIKAGKGIYKGLHGSGKAHATISGQTLTATYTGKAHFDGQKAKNGTSSSNGKAKGKSK